jgi:hypothetical protein
MASNTSNNIVKKRPLETTSTTKSSTPHQTPPSKIIKTHDIKVYELITCTIPEDKKPIRYIAKDEALRFLESLPDSVEIAPIVVSGVYRKGKSTLLNALLGYYGIEGAQIFQTSQDPVACTIGMTICSKLLDGIDPNTKRPIKLLLIDSEGTESTREGATQEHNRNIYTLCALLASTLIINAGGAIEQMTLIKLKDVTEVCESIESQAKQQVTNAVSSTTSSSNFKGPRLIYCARDYNLNFTDQNHKPLSPDAYFEDNISYREKDDDNMKRIKQCLRTFFQTRKLFAFPYPHSDSNKTVTHVRKEEFNPKFVQKVNDLTLYLKSNTNALKDIHGTVMNGRIFANLVRFYVKKINEGGIPNLEEAYTSMSHVCCLTAKSNSLSLFKDTVSRSNIEESTPDDLKKVFETAHELALKEFHSGKVKAYGDRKEEVKMDLLKEIEKEKQQFIKLNEVFVQKLINREVGKMTEKVTSEFELIFNNPENVVNNMDQQCKDIISQKLKIPSIYQNKTCYALLCNEIEHLWKIWLIKFSQQMMVKHKELNLKCSQLSDSHDKMKLTFEEQKEEIEKHLGVILEITNQKKTKDTEYEKKIQEIKEQQQKTIDNLNDMFQVQQQQLQQEIQSTSENALKLQATITNNTQQYNQTLLEYEQSKCDMKNQIETLSQDLSSIKEDLEEKHEELKKNSVQLNQLNTVSMEFENLKQQYSNQSREYDDILAKYDTATREYTKRLTEERQNTESLVSGMKRRYEDQISLLNQSIKTKVESEESLQNEIGKMKENMEHQTYKFDKLKKEKQEVEQNIAQEQESFKLKQKQFDEEQILLKEANDQQLKNISSKFSSTIATMKESQQQLINSKDEQIQKLTESSIQLEKKLIEATTSLTHLQKQIENADQKQKYKKLEQNNALLKAEKEGLDERVIQQQNLINNHSNEIMKLKNDNIKLQQKITETERDCATKLHSEISQILQKINPSK